MCLWENARTPEQLTLQEPTCESDVKPTVAERILEDSEYDEVDSGIPMGKMSKGDGDVNDRKRRKAPCPSVPVHIPVHDLRTSTVYGDPWRSIRDLCTTCTSMQGSSAFHSRGRMFRDGVTCWFTAADHTIARCFPPNCPPPPHNAHPPQSEPNLAPEPKKKPRKNRVAKDRIHGLPGGPTKNTVLQLVWVLASMVNTDITKCSEQDKNTIRESALKLWERNIKPGVFFEPVELELLETLFGNWINTDPPNGKATDATELCEVLCSMRAML